MRKLYRCEKKAGASFHLSFIPSTYVIGILESSASLTPSKQPTLTPYILPMGVSLPTPNVRLTACEGTHRGTAVPQ